MLSPKLDRRQSSFLRDSKYEELELLINHLLRNAVHATALQLEALKGLVKAATPLDKATVQRNVEEIEISVQQQNNLLLLLSGENIDKKQALQVKMMFEQVRNDVRLKCAELKVFRIECGDDLWIYSNHSLLRGLLEHVLLDLSQNATSLELTVNYDDDEAQLKVKIIIMGRSAQGEGFFYSIR